MTSEEFEKISHECGYNTVRDSRFTINQEILFNPYASGCIIPINYKVYKLGMRKKVYRNYLLRMKRKYKNAQVELKKYRIEKDF